MATLRLRLLGQPLVWRDDQPARFKTRKALAILAYLAVEGGLPAREQFATLLWPDYDLTDARRNLRTTLSYVHQALGNGALTTTHEAIGLDPSAPLALDLDLQSLSRVRRLARTSEGDDVPELRTQLEQAVALYRGPFLAGLDIPDAPEFEAWLAGQRAYWLGVAGELLERLAGLQAAACDLGAARGTLERWVALEPGEERAWQQLLTLALEAGDLVGARRGWAACRAALAELGVQPGEPLQTLARQIGAAQVARPCSLMRASQEGAYGGLGQAPLVGRAGPLATLRRTFARAQAGQTQLVVLHGEAGIGKTRLASEFLAWTRSQGADVLVGRAFEAEGSLPYAPLVAALRSRLERENAPEDLLGDLWLTELARLLPELRERYPDLPPATEDGTLGPGRLCEAVARLGQALVARSPLVLFLDDMQWADLGTRDLVRYTLRRWAESGVRAVVLLAVRVDGAGRQGVIEPWLGSLECEAPTTWLEPERLATEDVVCLVAALAGDTPEGEYAGPHEEEVVTFGHWLAGRTGGHPFFMMQLLQTLLDDGVLRLRPAAGGDQALDVRGALRTVATSGYGGLLPAGVRALISAQVGRLDETAAEVLAAGTVLGGAFSAEQVLRVAAVEERSGERALDQLVRGRLLRELPETGEYTVGDELVREVLYATLGEARRRRLHQRTLVALEAGEFALQAQIARGAPARLSPNRAGALAAKQIAEQSDPACQPVFAPRAIVDIRAHDGHPVRGRDQRDAPGVPLFAVHQGLAHAPTRRIRRALRRLGQGDPVQLTLVQRDLPAAQAPGPRGGRPEPVAWERLPAALVAADPSGAAPAQPSRTPRRGRRQRLRARALRMGARAADSASTLSDRSQQARSRHAPVRRGEEPYASAARPPPRTPRPTPAGVLLLAGDAPLI